MSGTITRVNYAGSLKSTFPPPAQVKILKLFLFFLDTRTEDRDRVWLCCNSAGRVGYRHLLSRGTSSPISRPWFLNAPSTSCNPCWGEHTAAQPSKLFFCSAVNYWWMPQKGNVHLLPQNLFSPVKIPPQGLPCPTNTQRYLKSWRYLSGW